MPYSSSPSVDTGGTSEGEDTHFDVTNVDDARAAAHAHVQNAVRTIVRQRHYAVAEQHAGLADPETGMPVMVKLKETKDVLKVLVQLLELFANDRLSSAYQIWCMVRLHVTKNRVTSILASLASGAELPLWAFRIRPAHEVMFAATDMRVVYADVTTEDMPSIHEVFIAHPDGVVGFNGKADYILVAEKESVLRRLISSGILEDPSLGYGVLVTGKCEPDNLTKQLFSKVAKAFPSAQVLGLFDPDPWGLMTMSVLKYGSHNGHQAPDDRWCPRMKWAGIGPSQCHYLGIEPEQFYPLKPESVSIVENMLDSRHTDTVLLPELTLMRIVGATRIEAAYSAGDGRQFIDFVRSKIQEP